MSAASKATTARQRANIAAQMIKKQNHFYRAFDDCFEMGDGAEVLQLLVEKAKTDRRLALEIISKSYYMPYPLRQAAEGRMSYEK